MEFNVNGEGVLRLRCGTSDEACMQNDILATFKNQLVQSDQLDLS